MRRDSRPAAGLFLFIVLFGLVLGCRQEVPPLFRRNQRPETTLTIVPEDSTQGYYRYHVYWRGEDSDGRVVRYIFAITDTLSRNEEENWNPQIAEDRDRGVYTEKTDSIFVFNSERGRGAMNITAIDDFGDRDQTPARGFFRIVNNGIPTVRFLDVTGFRSDVTLPPCQGADPCTIPTFTNFKIRFTGATGNNRIIGLQWQGIPPGVSDPEPFQPFGSDTLFVRIGSDTTGFDPVSSDTTWTLRGDAVTVYYYSDRASPLPTGNFQLRVRVLDEANLTSFLAGGTRLVTLNYDPDTQLYRIPACDCPHPPPNCGSLGSVRAGWITGVDGTAFADSSRWIRFCEGDTLPQRAWVQFYARGSDDPRDLPTVPPTLRDVGFSGRYEFHIGRPPDELGNKNMPFSSEYPIQDYVLPPPDGSSWRGRRIGWGSRTFPGLCPFDFVYFVSAVDENGKRDGTPDSLAFFVGGSPSVDSVRVPLVLVLAPTCPQGRDPFCPDLSTLSFGADTVLVVGEYVPDPDPSRPFYDPRPGASGFGSNRFHLALQVFAHDHPRDHDNPPAYTYSPANVGRVKAWKYSITCTLPGCEDLNLGGEGQWRPDTRRPSDPANQEIFDDDLLVPLELDTVRTPGVIPFKTMLPTASLGPYRFEQEGRDTEYIGETCIDPSDLGPSPAAFTRNISEVGRATPLTVRSLIIRQLQDVRPYVPPRAAAAQARDSRKGWWRR